jgi:hypothetical protein
VLCRASSGASPFRDSLDLTSPANLKKLQIIRNEYVTPWIQKTLVESFTNANTY